MRTFDFSMGCLLTIWITHNYEDEDGACDHVLIYGDTIWIILLFEYDYSGYYINIDIAVPIINMLDFITYLVIKLCCSNQNHIILNNNYVRYCLCSFTYIFLEVLLLIWDCIKSSRNNENGIWVRQRENIKCSIYICIQHNIIKHTSNYRQDGVI